jgi:hypothetical protein
MRMRHLLTKRGESSMNTFYVTVDFESKTFEIQADSVEEAKAKVQQLHEEGRGLQ